VHGIWEAHLKGEFVPAGVEDDVALRAAGVLAEKGYWNWMFQAATEDLTSWEDLQLQAAFPLGASPVIEPPVPPLLEPRLPQPISRDPGSHIPFCELLHELVVRLAVAR
jgi:hypothetical protein